MAFRHTKYTLPFSNATLSSHMHRIKSSGSGMGSVLLSTGGPGAGSSYRDIDEYVSTTGINPYSRSRKAQTPSGSGLQSRLAEKLSKLTTEPTRRRKNITMSL
jgi:hypothetical protein